MINTFPGAANDSKRSLRPRIAIFICQYIVKDQA
ncbi:hypothetical protein M7I_5508 [Glarea lozoyensis 74030]|uniref:Uncharacterized protein n=1 Tax=Glarea lozoyensis (strain ATCC 74030 / MF5533) TaxID=1104152 RepID=H0ES33_GLAL7|nr:hypothetical protein M7I_5508 [Glarea lozoyensis 74030]